MYLKKIVDNQLIFTKSKFIALACPVDTLGDAKEVITQVKEKYHDATQICYAYRIDNEVKYTDDKEPSGTAGRPLFTLIENHQLNHVIILVVRYFGGVKLGVGPLTRAYLKSGTKLLEKALIINEYGTYEITFNYHDLNQIEYLLNGIEIIKKNMDNICTYTILLTDKTLLNIPLIKSIKHLK